MGKLYDEIDAKLEAWIAAQPMFFVATAPRDGGRVNVSPKGVAGTFRVLGPRQVAYVDLIGSGIETVAHLRENGRVTLMFCAFAGPPRIVRLYGRGRVEQPLNGEIDGARATIVVDVDRIADSCGYGVPLMGYEGERPQRLAWLDRKRRAGELEAYVAEKNALSIDGLPGL
jgi:predicted pyridoxine 5'-phosphate oxidase superfamily flavin-nucleotide-binding protein